MQISAVLFDLDGTLTDSNRSFVEAVRHGLSCFDIEMERAHFDTFHTNFLPWRHLFALHGRQECDEKEFERMVMEKQGEILQTDSRWMEDAKDVIDMLKKRNMPIGIVTNSFDAFIDILDRSLSLRSLFPVIITADITKEQRKPKPKGLLLAAEQLNVYAHDCLYVGDQRFDMLAAQAAGMHECLFIGPHTPADVELMAKHRVRKLPEMLKLID
jgi:HAD superfamily hydrolase (TIGR01549 family)